MNKRHFSAEWEPHEATWIAWPHNVDDWPELFEKIGTVYVAIVKALHTRERVEILCDTEALREEAQDMLKEGGVDLTKCRFHLVPNDRSWLRDSGPTAVRRKDGLIEWICWQFNGWAKYDDWKKDQHVAREIAHISDLPIVEAKRPDGSPLVLEGGAIDTNGAGVLLTTEECLLSSEQERNPGMTKADYEKAFVEYLGIEKVIWLGKGCVGDDTHGHIDDIARFVSEYTILLAYEENPQDPNHESSVDNFSILYAATPRKYQIVKMPYPEPIFIQGERVPASYLNFYIANGIVLVPIFQVSQDEKAIATLEEVFPDREVIGINCRDLIWGLGTLHCLTQQQPSAPS